MDLDSFSLSELGKVYKDRIGEAEKYGVRKERFRNKPFFKSRDEAYDFIETVESSIRAAKESLLALDNDQEVIIQRQPEQKKMAKDIIPDTAIITVLATENPKSRDAATRFDYYYTGMPVSEYIEKVGDKNKALADIKWDTSRGWISWVLATEEAA